MPLIIFQMLHIFLIQQNTNTCADKMHTSHQHICHFSCSLFLSVCSTFQLESFFFYQKDILQYFLIWKCLVFSQENLAEWLFSCNNLEMMSSGFYCYFWEVSCESYYWSCEGNLLSLLVDFKISISSLVFSF